LGRLWGCSLSITVISSYVVGKLKGTTQNTRKCISKTQRKVEKKCTKKMAHGWVSIIIRQRNMVQPDETYHSLITVAQFLLFYWHKPCIYCGKKAKYVSWDRTDNEGGYTIDNVKPCCWDCNRHKMRLSEEEFIERNPRVSEGIYWHNGMSPQVKRHARWVIHRK